MLPKLSLRDRAAQTAVCAAQTVSQGQSSSDSCVCCPNCLSGTEQLRQLCVLLKLSLRDRAAQTAVCAAQTVSQGQSSSDSCVCCPNCLSGTEQLRQLCVLLKLSLRDRAAQTAVCAAQTVSPGRLRQLCVLLKLSLRDRAAQTTVCAAQTVSQGRLRQWRVLPETEVANQTYLTRSRDTDVGPTSLSTHPRTPGVRQYGHWSTNYKVIDMTLPCGAALWVTPWVGKGYGSKSRQKWHCHGALLVVLAICCDLPSTVQSSVSSMRTTVLPRFALDLWRQEERE